MPVKQPVFYFPTGLGALKCAVIAAMICQKELLESDCMNRHHVARMLGGSVALFVRCIWPLSSNVQTAAPRKPNLLFVPADDLGHGDSGCYGQVVIRSPIRSSLLARVTVH